MHYLKLRALFFFLFLFPLIGSAQPSSDRPDSTRYPYWLSMMQDRSIPFRETQRVFERFWEGRTDYKGNGWKVFKRWEYINEPRVMPDGKLPTPEWELKGIEEFQSMPKSLTGSWTLVGPISLPSNSTSQPNGIGRINGIGFHPTDGNTIFAGAASGGLWKSTDGGTTWSYLTANLPTLGVSSVVVHPSTPATIWVGTGDRDASDAPGYGVYKSTDGGATWSASNTGMGNLTVGMMILHPTDPLIILAATSSGIYKTTNGGTSWTRKSSNTSNYKDIKFKPGDPSVVYATEGGRFYRSADTGETWTQITSGVLSGTRLVIGVTPADPAVVYIYQTTGSFTGLLRSSDSGQNFTTQATTPNIVDYACDGSGTSSQASYDLCIAVDPANANTVFCGAINIWKSINAGVTLTICTHWVGSAWGTTCAPSVHADIHALSFSPVNGKLYTGCDGGIYVTTNGGTSWSDISSGISAAQVYKIGQSATSQTLCINGYQDNGTSSNLGTSFTTVIGGDGMECIIDYSNSSYRYGALYYGDIRRSSGGGYSTIAKNGSNGITESGAWVTPYTLHETDPNTMFVGYKNVWRSNNVKASSASSVTWTTISTGETASCSVLETSPANVDILYVVRSGSLKRTDNANAASGSVTWTTCALPGGNTPTDLEAHPTNANIVYATGGTGVYKSTDKGATWTQITGGLPSSYTKCLVYDKNSNEGLYVGNESGVFYKDATLSNWTAFSNGLPIVSVRELEIYYDASNAANNRLKAATYGRGLWQSDLIESGIINPSVFAATPASTTQINLSWTKNANNNNVMVAWSSTPTIGVPANGTAYAAGASIPGGGTVLYNGSGTSFNHTGLTANTVYYYRAWSVDGSVAYSAGNQINATTLCAVSLPPFAESFAGTSAPSCWSVTDNQGSGQVWSFGTVAASYSPLPALTGNYAYLNSDAYGSGNTQNSDLVSPTLNLNGYNNITLSFNHYFRSYSGSSGTVSYSTNNGTSWTTLTSFSSTTANPAAFSQVITDLANQSQVKLKWNYTGTYGWYWGIDDIQLTGSIIPTLTVLPASRSVGADAGSTNFIAFSNSDWTVTSDQPWCTVTPSGSGNSVITANYSANSGTAQRTANITVTVVGLTPVVVTVVQAGVSQVTVNLSLGLEGLYAGSGMMNPARNATGPQWGASIADKINVELHSGSLYATVVYSVNDLAVSTSGTATFTVPAAYNGNYYITVKHRNSITTVSSVPMSFASTPVTYSFKTASSSAFGNNMKQVEPGYYAFYSGDLNQDGTINSTDLTSAYDAASAFSTGYISSDVNGDGSVDITDISFIDNNSATFVSVITP